MRFKHANIWDIPGPRYWNHSRHSCNVGGSASGDFALASSTPLALVCVHVCVCVYSPFLALLAASSPPAHLPHHLLMNTSLFLLSHLEARHCSRHRGWRCSRPSEVVSPVMHHFVWVEWRRSTSLAPSAPASRPTQLATLSCLSAGTHFLSSVVVRTSCSACRHQTPLGGCRLKPVQIKFSLNSPR